MPRPRLSRMEWDCAQRVFQRQHADDIRSFLQTHPLCIHHTNNIRESTLIYAITSNNTVLTKVLIEMGANIHDGCHWKNIQHSPLFVALITHRWHMARLLLQHGADVNREINGMTILERLVRYEDQYGLEPLQFILELGADPNRITTWTDSSSVCRHSRRRRMGQHNNNWPEEYVQHYPKLRESGSYLIMAMATGKMPSANILLQYADVTMRDSRGRCALSYTIEQDLSIDWIHSILGKRSKHCRDFPLELAVRRGNAEIVRLFLQRGADPFQRIEEGTCTLFELACSEDNVPVIFEFLHAHPTVCLRRDDREGEAHGNVFSRPCDYSNSSSALLMENRDDDDTIDSVYELPFATRQST